MIVYRLNLFLLIVFLFVQIQDATPRGDSASSIRSPNPLISYRLDEEDNNDKNDYADMSHANSHEDIESDEKSKERSFQNPSRRRPTRFRDATLSSTTSIRSPTNRLIAYRLDEGENFDKNDYGGKSRTSSHSRKNRRRHEDYYDDVEDEKKKESGEKSTENQETSTESQELSSHLLVASQETTIRSPTHRLISYRLEESDHTPTHQFQKAKKAAHDFNLSRRVKRATKKVEETRTRKKDFVDDDDDDLYSYYQWRLRRARLLRRLRELDAESPRPTPTCCRSYRNPRYYPSYYQQQPYYGRSPYYSYPSYGTYYPSYGGYGSYGGYRPLGGYGGYPPQALDLGIGWGVNVGVPAAGLGVGVNSGLGVTVG